ncbi:hypothetical protein BGZ80_004731, partial [Entomortierella chlamydospora]
MGNFLSQFNELISKDVDSKVPDVQLDFEDSSMSDEDLESYSNVLNMLEPTAELLEMLRTYEGCGEYIRQ